MTWCQPFREHKELTKNTSFLNGDQKIYVFGEMVVSAVVC
jgi:hypothetical protein